VITVKILKRAYNFFRLEGFKSPAMKSLKSGKRSPQIALAAVVACLISLSACGGGSATSQVNTPTAPTLSITPASPSFLVGATQQFSATETVNGTPQDVTKSVSWTVSSLNPVSGALTSTQAASFPPNSSPGLATGVAAGPITVTATINGLKASVTGVVNAIPLIDMTSSQTYKGFEGGLYQGSSPTVTDPKHDADGIAAANAIQPLDTNGQPAAIPTGAVVVVGIGMSNWTDELCAEKNSPPGPFFNANNQCDSYTFIGQAGVIPNPSTNTILVDCAIASEGAANWVSDAPPNGKTVGNYTACAQLLDSFGLSPKQVQVLLWKDADPSPGPAGYVSLTDAAQGQTPSQYCAAHVHTPPVPGDVDACVYEQWVGDVAREAKIFFPNLQQMFLHSRIYAGYALTDLNPEPFTYEYGLATKWLIQAQIDETNSTSPLIDPTAGDLRYQVGSGQNSGAAAPWIAWGPYFWASGITPRTDGEVDNLTWVPSDYSNADYTHPSSGTSGGRMKVANMMVNWYQNSPYTPWF